MRALRGRTQERLVRHEMDHRLPPSNTACTRPGAERVSCPIPSSFTCANPEFTRHVRIGSSLGRRPGLARPLNHATSTAIRR